MGPCFSQKQTRTMANVPPSQFFEDETIDNDTKKPMFSTLFNILRKPNQLEILRYGSDPGKYFYKQSSPNLQTLTASDMKMLYSFKNLLLIGNYQSALQKIKTTSNPKSIYCCDQKYALNFLQRFPIFSAQQQIKQARFVPIYAFNSEQTRKKGQKKQIFLHSQSNQNQQIYTQMRISQILNDNPAHTVEQMGQLLQNCSGSSILFLHSKQRKPDDLLNMLCYFVVAQYGVTPLNAKIYLRRSLPQTSLNQQILPTENDIKIRKSLQAVPNQQLTLTETYQKHFQQLYQQMGGNSQAKGKIDRAYHLLVTLLSNICNNKGSQNYRTIRKTNPQINQLLGKYKYGVKLLRSVGFLERGSDYFNNMDVKYLKIYRTDLDMGFRNFINSHS